MHHHPQRMTLLKVHMHTILGLIITHLRLEKLMHTMLFVLRIGQN